MNFLNRNHLTSQTVWICHVLSTVFMSFSVVRPVFCLFSCCIFPAHHYVCLSHVCCCEREYLCCTCFNFFFLVCVCGCVLVTNKGKSFHTYRTRPHHADCWVPNHSILIHVTLLIILMFCLNKSNSLSLQPSFSLKYLEISNCCY